MAIVDEALARAAEKLRPPARIPLSQWIETHMRLPEGLAAKPGPIRLWPFQSGIADAISDPSIERVTVRKSARVGFSTLLTGTLASYVANEPAPLLYHRYPERIHQVAAVHVPLPKKAKLDECEPSLDSPSKIRLLCPHYGLLASLPAR